MKTLSGWITVPAALSVLVSVSAPVSAFVLSNQSNITTGIGAGFNGADISVRPADAFVMGFDHNSAPGGNGSRAATSFTLSAEGNLISSVTVFSYSISDIYPSPPISPFTGISVNIWNGMPGTPGSTLLFSSSTLSSTSWTGIYRVPITNTQSTRRPVMEVSAGFGNVFLPAGTYWADWAITGVEAPGVSSDIYVPPLMNPDGSIYLGQAMGYDAGTGQWTQMFDINTPVGLPLRIEGNAIPEPLTTTGWLLIGGVGMLRRFRKP